MPKKDNPKKTQKTTKKINHSNSKRLKRKQQMDLFICELTDIALRDDQASMEHPLFTLSKKPDRKNRLYEHNGNSIEVIPGTPGMPTIWDKDVLIYAVSHLTEAKNRGMPIKRRVSTNAHDILYSCDRGTGGASYHRLLASLKRLWLTGYRTTIQTNGVAEQRWFSLISDVKVVTQADVRLENTCIEFDVCDWLFRAVEASEVLAISPEYFELTGGLERRLYELARKHCGHQLSWPVGLKTLHKKCGSQSSLKLFRSRIKSFVENSLPDYRLMYYPAKNRANERVVFYSKSPRGHKAALRDIIRA